MNLNIVDLRRYVRGRRSRPSGAPSLSLRVVSMTAYESNIERSHAFHDENDG